MRKARGSAHEILGQPAICESTILTKFLLHKGLGSSTVDQIGDYPRCHGTGRHWIERYRGDIFVFVSDQADEAILKKEFPGLLDAVNDTPTNGIRRR
jgi:hypothetical protein